MAESALYEHIIVFELAILLRHAPSIRQISLRRTLATNADEIADAIAAYPRSPELVLEHAANGAEIARRYSWGELAAKVEPVLDALTGEMAAAGH